MVKFENRFISMSWFWKMLPIGAAIFGIGFVLMSAKLYGIGATPDSVGYLSVAQNLREGHGLVDWQGSPLVVQPPLYPLLLAVVNWLFSINFPDAARWISALGLASTLFIMSKWCIEHLRSHLLKIAAIASICVAVPYSQVFVYAWSETIFIPLFIIVLLLFLDYSSDSSLRTLIFIAIITGICTLTRYAGVALVPIATIVVCLVQRHSARLIIGRLSLFLSIALAPLGIWLLRNYIMFHTLTAQHYTNVIQASIKFGAAVDASLSSMIGWFIPYFIPESVKLVVATTWILLVVGFMRSVRERKQGANIFWNNQITGLTTLSIFTAFYVLFICAASAATTIPLPDTRFLAPIYAAIVLSITFVLDNIRLEPRSLVVASLPLWFSLGLMTLSTARDLRHFTKYGAGWWGYSITEWQTSPTLAYLKKISPSNPVYSNESDAIYYMTDIQTLTLPEDLLDLNHLRHSLNPSLPTYVVWFNSSYNPYYSYTAIDVPLLIGTKPIFNSKDGSIYILEGGT